MLATRFECIHRDRFGRSCTKGTGKPRAKKCGYCGGALFVSTGLYGAFVWTAENRYPESAAVKTFRSEPRATRFADDNKLVVRWISKEMT